MGLLYKTVAPNGALEIVYNSPINPLNLPKWLVNSPGLIFNSSRTKITVQPRLCGGKGAFRQLMRNVGRTTTRSNNQSMARDLNGRRIRDVENEKRLQDWCDGEEDRRKDREEERKARLEKMAKRATDEQERKTYLDANFDGESQAMMDMMEESVNASFAITQELNSNIESLNKTIKQLKRPAAYNESKKVVKRTRRAAFGFDEDDFSSSDDEDEETLRLKAMGSIVGRKISETQRKSSAEALDNAEEMLRLKAVSSMVDKKEEEVLRMRAVDSRVEKQTDELMAKAREEEARMRAINSFVQRNRLKVSVDMQGTSSSSDGEKMPASADQEIPEPMIVEKPKEPSPQEAPPVSQEPLSVQCGSGHSGHVNEHILNPPKEATGSLVLIPPPEKPNRKPVPREGGPKVRVGGPVIVIDDEDAEVIDLTTKKPKEKRTFGMDMSYMNPKDTVSKPTSYPPIAMKWVTSVIELQAYGRDHLMHELKRRSVKHGGTVEQQAERLFSIKGLSKKQIPANIRVKRAKTPPPQIPVQDGGLATIQKNEKVCQKKKLTFEYGKLQEELGNVQFRKRYSGN